MPDDLSPEELQQLGAAYNDLLNDPTTREVVLRAQKARNPKLSIPEIDLKDQARGAFKDVATRQDKIEDELAKDRRERYVLERRAELRAEGFTGEEVTDIEKLMVAEQIPNYKTAATYYRNSKQLAAPTPNGGEAPGGATTYSLPADAMAAGKGGKMGLKKFALSQADAAVAELLAGRVKLH